MLYTLLKPRTSLQYYVAEGVVSTCFYIFNLLNLLS